MAVSCGVLFLPDLLNTAQHTRGISYNSTRLSSDRVLGGLCCVRRGAAGAPICCVTAENGNIKWAKNTGEIGQIRAGFWGRPKIVHRERFNLLWLAQHRHC